ncbi:MAG: hypothetical protein L6R35_003459 [Caloplaca aegaea]|nr:MAG: hypothetical protein L6R35_003459 [Caloplaca aegaea]
MVHGVSSAVEGGGGEEEEEVVLPTEPLIRPTIFSKGAFGGGHVMLVFGKQGGSQFLKTLSALKSRHRARPWTPLGGNSSCSLLMIWKGPKRGYSSPVHILSPGQTAFRFLSQAARGLFIALQSGTRRPGQHPPTTAEARRADKGRRRSESRDGKTSYTDRVT